MRLLVLLIISLIQFQAFGACKDNLHKTTPNSRFIINGDGTVDDLVSGLTWKRCAWGQVWNGSTCQGDSQWMTYSEASTAAYSESVNNGFMWRIPNAKELYSIVESSCVGPSINDTVFPNTQFDSRENGSWGGHWTSTITSDGIVVVYFAIGLQYNRAWYSSSRNRPRYKLRLVRDTKELPLPHAAGLYFSSENIPDYTYVTGDINKYWNFNSSETAYTGVKAVVTAADIGTGLSIGEEFSIGDVQPNSQFTLNVNTSISATGAAIKYAEFELRDANGILIEIGNSAANKVWLKVRTNRPPQFAPDQLFDLAGPANTDLHLKLAGSDLDGDNLTFSIENGVGQIIDNTLVVNVAEGQNQHTVTVSVSDGKETISQDVTVRVLTPDSILSFYSDVTQATSYRDAILFATLQGLLIGNSTDGGITRQFEPERLPSWPEVLKMVLGAVAYRGDITLATDNLLKAPGTVPSWVDAYYTTGRLLNIIDANIDLSAQPTNEDIARLLVGLLSLEQRYSSVFHFLNMPAFSAGICTGGAINNCFSSAKALKEAQLTNLFGLFMRNLAANPQGLVNRGEMAEVMARVLMMPSFDLSLTSANNSIEHGESATLTMSNLTAIVSQSAGELVMATSAQPNPASHTRINQIYLDATRQLSEAVTVADFTGLEINSQPLSIGKHTITVEVENTENGSVGVETLDIEVVFTDTDKDGVRDVEDSWPNDQRYAYDDNQNGLPDSLDELWLLESANENTIVYLRGEATGYTYSEAIANDLPLDWADDDYDGITDDVDAFPNNEAASKDYDGDGMPDTFHENCDEQCINNSGLALDLDDDNDGYTDLDELANGTDSLDASSLPADNDGDFISDVMDTDDDNDGVPDTDDQAPFDPDKYDLTAPTVIAPNNIEVPAVDMSGVSANDENLSVFLSSANASDDIDGELTVSNDAPDVFPIGVTTVTFSASDTSGNRGAASATVTVSDQSAPVITLNGDTTITLYLGDTFNEPGFSALDNVGGDVTERVVVSGTLDTNELGTYTLMYNVSDAAGNTAVPQSRQVTVALKDSDNDGITDDVDAFPNNEAASQDYDGDGMPDTFHENCDEQCINDSGLALDLDDDNDGYTDLDELANGTDSLDASSLPADNDGDFISDVMDTDDDNDGVPDEIDSQPFIPNIFRVKNDVDGDGKSDLLWRSYAKGWNFLWTMNGTQINSATPINVVPEYTWDMVGQGDYDADGKSDIFWRNSVTGQNFVYLMDGASIKSRYTLNYVGVPDWKLASSGDFDGDGTGDVLWRNVNRGDTWFYLMSGGQIRDSQPSLWVTDLNYEIAATGDIDGDGDDDVIWRNVSNGINYVWLMQSGSIASRYTLNRIGIDWHIAGSGDLDGDGTDDIILRNQVDGRNWVYFMENGQIRESTLINTVADTNWDIANIGDYDGDGKADFLWRHAPNARNLVHLMDGTAIKAKGVLRPTDSTWQVAQ